MKRIFFSITVIAGFIFLYGCDGTTLKSSNESEEIAKEEEEMPVIKSTSELIQDAVDEQDFNEVNRMMSKLLSNHDFDIDKAMDTWKQELKYCLKNNELDIFIDMVSVINSYELENTPIVNEKMDESPRVNERYVEEVGKFNSMCDNLLNTAILYENSQIANQIINLYRKGITKKVKKEARVETYREQVGTREETYYVDNTSTVGEFLGLRSKETRTVPVYKDKQRTNYVEVYEWVWSTEAQDAARKTLRNAGLDRKRK